MIIMIVSSYVEIDLVSWNHLLFFLTLATIMRSFRFKRNQWQAMKMEVEMHILCFVLHSYTMYSGDM